MIIGLSGEKQSGKDTIASYLIKEHGFERKAFADPLKQSVAALFNIPFHEVDKHKTEDNCYVMLGYVNDPELTHDKLGPDHMWSPITRITMREFLQRYGTESHREIFSFDFWLDITLPIGGYYAGKKIVVTDCRFDNEAERIITCGGVNIKVSRPGILSQDRHSSEAGISKHLLYGEIVNDSTLADLFKDVEKLLENLTTGERND